jgi:hypothetical protein
VSHFVSRSSEGFETARERLHLQRVAAEDVHLLSDSADAETCRKIYVGVDEYLGVHGGHAGLSLPIFYRGGPYYFAVYTLTPHTAAPPGMVHIDARWSPMYVLDSEFKVLAVIAI